MVVAEDARGYYALVDGNTRLWDKPKWKNPRHVQLTHDIIAEVFDYDYDNLGDNPDASMNKNMPWNDIFAAIFMAILPLIVVIFASNIIIRGTFFYSFYFTRTDVVKEIPYEIKKDQLIENFGKYMQHRKSDFQIKENSKYKPQNVFADRGISITH